MGKKLFYLKLTKKNNFRMIYSTVSRILCLHNEINLTHVHQSHISIEISTSNSDLIDYSLQLNMTELLLEYKYMKIGF